MTGSTPSRSIASDPFAPDPERGLGPEEIQTTRTCLWVLGLLSTGSLTGVAFSLYLVNHFPLLLVAISPLGRHIVLVTPLVDPVALVAVVTLRRMAFYLASFHLGRALGPRAIPWIEERAAWFAGFVRWLESLFARAANLVVLFMAGPTVSALAGISGMRPRTFTLLAAIGLTLRLILLVMLAAYVRDEIEVALAWIDRYWLPGTVVMVTGVALYRWRRRIPADVMED